MAYIDQAKKAGIVTNLKKVIPQGWKWSVSIRHHSTLVLTITSAPVDLIAEYLTVGNDRRAQCGAEQWMRPNYTSVNTHHMGDAFGESQATMNAIRSAMNDGNHDRSDWITDYCDVGWFVDINFGRWDKPFVCTAAAQVAA